MEVKVQMLHRNSTFPLVLVAGWDEMRLWIPGERIENHLDLFGTDLWKESRLAGYRALGSNPHAANTQQPNIGQGNHCLRVRFSPEDF